MRRLLIILSLAAILLVGGLVAYWLIARGILEDGIAEWAEGGRAKGAEIAYGGPEIAGFPLRLLVRITDPQGGYPAEGLAWQGPDFTAYAWLWDLSSITVEGEGEHRLATPDVILLFSHAASKAEIGLSDGELNSVSLDFASPVLTTEGNNQSLASKRFFVSAGPLQPEKDGRFHSDFELQWQEFQIPPLGAIAIQLFGPTLENLSLKGKMTGALAGASPQEIAQTWRDSDGRIELDELHLHWADFELKASGTLKLDEANRLAGSLDVETLGLLPLLEKAVSLGLLDPEALGPSLQVLSALSTPTDDGRGKTTFKVSMQDGTLYLGPVAIGQLRRLF